MSLCRGELVNNWTWTLKKKDNSIYEYESRVQKKIYKEVKS